MDSLDVAVLTVFFFSMVAGFGFCLGWLFAVYVCKGVAEFVLGFRYSYRKARRS